MHQHLDLTMISQHIIWPQLLISLFTSLSTSSYEKLCLESSLILLAPWETSKNSFKTTSEQNALFALSNLKCLIDTAMDFNITLLKNITNGFTYFTSITFDRKAKQIIMDWKAISGNWLRMIKSHGFHYIEQCVFKS